MNGSGFIDLDDLVLALPELGIIDEDARWSRGNVQLMLTTLASQNHGSSGQGVTFNEFSSFISGMVDRDDSKRESMVDEQRQAVRTFSTRNTTSALHSDPHQLARQASAAVENVKKRLGIHDRKLRGVSSLSKVREALNSKDPSFTGRLNPSKARARLANLLHIEDTLLLQKDWNAFVDTLDQDQTGHIAINDLLCLLFSRCSDSDEKKLRRNKIGDEADVTMLHRSPYASAAPNMPRALEGKQLRNSVQHHGMTKNSEPNRFMAKEVCCMRRILPHFLQLAV